jgi:hypothetical protein
MTDQDMLSGRDQGGFSFTRLMPQEIPAVLTQVYVGNYVLLEVGGINKSGATVAITIRDGQSPPIFMADAVPIPPGGSFSQIFHYGRAFPGGLYWQASGPGLHAMLNGRV